LIKTEYKTAELALEQAVHHLPSFGDGLAMKDSNVFDGLPPARGLTPFMVLDPGPTP